MIRPLDPLNEVSSIARLLKSAPAEEAHAEMARLETQGLDPLRAAARNFAKGALGQREGALDVARESLSAAAAAFADLGETRASKIARCEALLAAVRRGPRPVYRESIATLEAITREADGDALVEVVATHYRGTAERLLGDAAATQRSLLWALERSQPFLDERAKILNSLGTLYVVMGAHGAARELLEHAAELHHQHGDVIGEAISFGQLGSAALALGNLERARHFLQRQEWLCSRVGDVFGQARALNFLADVASARGRPDDALALATRAREIAAAARPPLRLWIAYATRAIGRARMDLGDTNAREELEAAATLFGEVGNPLGAALTSWDRARIEARANAAAPEPRAHASFFGPASQLAALGLSGRVAEVLRDDRTFSRSDARASEKAIAAASQGLPHLSVAQEVELLHGSPDELARLAEAKTTAQRNLARLSSFCLAPPGLLVAAVASPSAGTGRPSLPSERSAAAAIADMPGLVVWAWVASAPVDEVARDLASLKVALGGDARARLSRVADARVLSAPLAGEVGPLVEALDLGPIVAAALSLPPGTLEVGAGITWDAEAEGRAVMAGFGVRRDPTDGPA
ncbi:tetratricopeptide repeat protein [Polyangium jinanense]|uniref:Tetratricopeptide repeat protein n=1 Tax=Polyangium jinanense TaxID=2829994 RepID=A0A9X3XC18_9BACT|nr:tetratricopeptide repeat protein [Polyangium jinanense]MDC3955935.1 tetratricopeptide repeat protein [Polyangium jinanense]MDC3985126.1 tetratricopeptide repeat protein [Polyangium jinanense]